MNYLLDTNVICEATAKLPETTVLAWIEAHAHECFLSSVSLGEIWTTPFSPPSGLALAPLTASTPKANS
jgi:predicted nucleic acid-binding protein